MLETRDTYTPAGLSYIIHCKKQQLKELHQQRIAYARRKQSDHPSYEGMTEQEFKRHIIEAIRFNLAKADRITQEIEKLEHHSF